MFSVGGINFSNGVYHNGLINGAEVFILQSAENTDKVVKDFEQVYSAGMDPNTVFSKVLDNCNLSKSDFTDLDIARINRKVESIYRTKNNEKRY